jgi:hypothetical protein
LTGVVVTDSRNSPVGNSKASHSTIGKVELREILCRFVRGVLVSYTRVTPLTSRDVISSAVLGVLRVRFCVRGAVIFIIQELLRCLEGSSKRSICRTIVEGSKLLVSHSSCTLDSSQISVLSAVTVPSSIYEEVDISHISEVILGTDSSDVS